MTNGDLLIAAEGAGYDLLITTDQNLRYQQNLKERKIAILVLMTTSWPKIQSHVSKVVEALDSMNAGDFIEITI